MTVAGVTDHGCVRINVICLDVQSAGMTMTVPQTSIAKTCSCLSLRITARMQRLTELSAPVEENVSTSVMGHAVQNARRIGTVLQGNTASGEMCLVFKINVKMCVTNSVLLILTVGTMDLVVMTVSGLGQEEDARIEMIKYCNCFYMIGNNSWFCNDHNSYLYKI